MRLTLDANVLIHAIDEAAIEHARAYEILHRAVDGDCVQTLQSLAETFAVVSRKPAFAHLEARRAVDHVRGLFPVVHAEPHDLEEAMRVVEHHKIQFWNAMLWATAKRAGCLLILSRDFQDGRVLDGVTIVDPFNAANDRLIDFALPPQE